MNLVKNSFPLFVCVHHDKFAVASSVKVVTLFDSISSTHPAQTGSTLTQTTKLSKTMLVSHVHLHLHIMDHTIELDVFKQEYEAVRQTCMRMAEVYQE